MDVSQAIAARTSVRAFAPTPVQKKTVEKIIGAGTAAPSKGNSQIWEFTAVAGSIKKDLDAMLLKLLKDDFMPAMQLSNAEDSNQCQALDRAARRSSRNSDEISRILSPLGIDIETFMLEGTFTFFNAPVAILVFANQVFANDLPHILSIGAAVQNMLLTAVHLGLGACWIGGVWRYTKEIRKLLHLPNDLKLLSSMALGYPAQDSPVSSYKSSRDDLSEFIRWIGFDSQEGQEKCL